MRKVLISALFICLLIPSIGSSQSGSDGNLPKEKAGTINPPTGKIAFIRDNNLWAMDWNGQNQFKVVSAENASGKLSWSPDGKKIAFCRSGSVDVQTPDHLGGKHKVYDIFVGYLDSALSKDKPTTNWWRRLTSDLGSRYPEWYRNEDKIIFTKDLNANFVNSQYPNYQICFMDSIGENYEVLRRDWQDSQNHMLMPTLGPNNNYAFVYVQNVTPQGILISSLDQKSLSKADMDGRMKYIKGGTAPAWSPDGKWIAYIMKAVDAQGIFITNPDLTENYLVYKPGIGQTLQTYPLSWAPDSKWLTFALGDGSVWIIDITGNGLRQVLGPGSNEAPAWSK